MARVCDNCGTRENVSSRPLGRSVSSRDQRECETPSYIDLDNECWAFLRAGDFDGLLARRSTG